MKRKKYLSMVHQVTIHLKCEFLLVLCGSFDDCITVFSFDFHNAFVSSVAVYECLLVVE